MSLSRTDLKLIGLNDDQIESVIAAHSETVSALKQKYSELEARYSSVKENADRLPAVQKELDDLRKEDYKGKYDNLFASVEKGKARAAKETAVKAYYEGKNIRGQNLTIAMRGTDLDALQLDDSGNLADTAALDALVDGDFRPLVTSARRTVSSGGTLAGHSDPPQTPNDTMNRILRGN